MANLADFVFLDENSTTTTSNELSVPYGADELVLQITAVGGASVDVTVQGKADKENGDWTALSVLNHTGYAMTAKATAVGIYSIAANGIKLMRVVSGGSAGSVIAFGSAVCSG